MNSNNVWRITGLVGGNVVESLLARERVVVFERQRPSGSAVVFSKPDADVVIGDIADERSTRHPSASACAASRQLDVVAARIGSVCGRWESTLSTLGGAGSPRIMAQRPYHLYPTNLRVELMPPPSLVTKVPGRQVHCPRTVLGHP
jgi:hypothetical protein